MGKHSNCWNAGKKASSTGKGPNLWKTGKKQCQGGSVLTDEMLVKNNFNGKRPNFLNCGKKIKKNILIAEILAKASCKIVQRSRCTTGASTRGCLRKGVFWHLMIFIAWKHSKWGICAKGSPKTTKDWKPGWYIAVRGRHSNWMFFCRAREAF